MKKILLVVVFAAMQILCHAQKFDGDWKGKIVYDDPAGYTEEFIFHIVGDECSEELVRRSAGDVKEQIIEMEISDDEIGLVTRHKKLFIGKLVKGKIVGKYYLNKEKYLDLTLTKYGKGEISAKSNYTIDRRNGLVVF